MMPLSAMASKIALENWVPRFSMFQDPILAIHSRHSALNAVSTVSGLICGKSCCRAGRIS